MAIRIDYANARAQAQKLLNISAECGQVRNTVLREKDSLPEYWYGDSGATTMELLQAWSSGMESLENDFQELSQLITRTANEMEEEERQREERIRAVQTFHHGKMTTSAREKFFQQLSETETKPASGSDWTASVKTNIGSSVNHTVSTIADTFSSFGKSILSKLTRR